MAFKDLNKNIELVKNGLGNKNPTIVRRFHIGKKKSICAAIIYVNALADKTIIDRDILNPLMLHVNEDLNGVDNLAQYLEESYISMCNTTVGSNINEAVEAAKRGKTVLLLEGSFEFVVLDTIGGVHRTIADPANETVIRGSREGFVENIETNISIIRRRVKDKNLVVEHKKIGRRSQTDLAVIYIEGVADENIVKQVKDRISLVDVDFVPATGMLEQYMDQYKFNIFPQFKGTERPDKVEVDIMEGRVAIIMEGTPYVITIPSLFTEFFQTMEDYTQKTIPASLLRLLRFLSVAVVLTLGPFYLTLVKANNEFLPLKFIIPIAQAREGIALSITAEIFLLEFIVELLREGGLRLPSKIGQTLSVVGGIIVGDAATKSRVVSSTTLLVVGVTTISTFLINNYDMSVAIRFLRFPMLLLASLLGIYGIAIGWFIIIVYLSSLQNFGVPYLNPNINDAKDQFVRGSLWNMNKRPDSIPNKDPIRQTDFKQKIGDDGNE